MPLPSTTPTVTDSPFRVGRTVTDTFFARRPYCKGAEYVITYKPHRGPIPAYLFGDDYY